MIFLIPLVIFIGVLFGIDYVYFSDADKAIKHEKIEKNKANIDELIKKYSK